MFQDTLIRLEDGDPDVLLERINPLLEGSPFQAQTADIYSRDVSFYPGYRFLKICDQGVTPAHIKNVLYSENDVIVLGGGNEFIYALNDRLPIILTADNVCDYVRFFFTHVRGKKGRFVVVETIEDIPWKEEPPPSARRAIGNMIKAVSYCDPVDLGTSISAENGSHYVEACFLFKTALFLSFVEIKSNGRVQVVQEELLVEDMPVLDDTTRL